MIYEVPGCCLHTVSFAVEASSIMMKIVSRHGNNKRSSTNPKFIFLDEADMFCKGEHEDILARGT